MPITIKLVALIFAALAFISCVESSYELPSGKKIKSVKIETITFPNGERARVMTYQSDIAIENKVKLREEVGEIWLTFQKDVEQSHLDAAAIRAVNAGKSGPVELAKGYGFAFKKKSNGEWFCLDDE